MSLLNSSDLDMFKSSNIISSLELHQCIEGQEEHLSLDSQLFGNMNVPTSLNMNTTYNPLVAENILSSTEGSDLPSKHLPAENECEILDQSFLTMSPDVNILAGDLTEPNQDTQRQIEPQQKQAPSTQPQIPEPVSVLDGATAEQTQLSQSQRSPTSITEDIQLHSRKSAASTPTEKRKGRPPLNKDPRLIAKKSSASKRKAANNLRGIVATNTVQAGPATPKGGKRGPKEKKNEKGKVEFDDAVDEIEEDSDEDSNRKKIKIEFIGAKRNRQVTFLKRKNGVMKKAMELGVLTGCDIGIIVHNTDNGKTFEYSSREMEKVLHTYGSYSGPLERRTTNKFFDLAGSKMSVNIPLDDPKLSQLARNAAHAAAARPRPYHKFEPSSSVKVVRVNGKRLSSGETAPVSVKKREVPGMGTTVTPGINGVVNDQTAQAQYQTQLEPQAQAQHQFQIHMQQQHQIQQQLQLQLQEHLQRQIQLQPCHQNLASYPNTTALLKEHARPPSTGNDKDNGILDEQLMFTRSLSASSDPAEPAPWMMDDAEPPANLLNFAPHSSSNALPDILPSVDVVASEEQKADSAKKNLCTTTAAIRNQYLNSEPSHEQPKETHEIREPPVSDLVPSKKENANALPPPPPPPLLPSTNRGDGENVKLKNYSSESGSAGSRSLVSIGLDTEVRGKEEESAAGSYDVSHVQSLHHESHNLDLSGFGMDNGTDLVSALEIRDEEWNAFMELTSPMSCDTETPSKFHGETADVDKLLSVNEDLDEVNKVHNKVGGSNRLDLESEENRWTSSWNDQEGLISTAETVIQPLSDEIEIDLDMDCDDGDDEEADRNRAFKLNIGMDVDEMESNIGINPVEDLFGAPEEISSTMLVTPMTPSLEE